MVEGKSERGKLRHTWREETVNHFFGIVFARAAGVTLQHVPYKGGVPQIVST